MKKNLFPISGLIPNLIKKSWTVSISEIMPPLGADVESLFEYFSSFVSFERTAGKNLVGLSTLNEALVSRGEAD